MKAWQAALLGSVQGLTEFLPVSSTAHLNLVARLFKWQSPGMVLDTSLHLGTLGATLFWLWQEEQQQGILNLPLLAKLVVATVPAGLAGILLERWIETHLRSAELTAVMLMLGGVLFWLAENQASKSKELEDITYADALWIGIAQMMALMPGLSRSGMTTAVGLIRGLKRHSSLRFSFLLSIPVVAGSGLFKLKDLRGIERSDLLQLLLTGGLSAAVTGYACLEWMLNHFHRRSLKGFTVYRILLGSGQFVLANRQAKRSFCL